MEWQADPPEHLRPCRLYRKEQVGAPRGGRPLGPARTADFASHHLLEGRHVLCPARLGRTDAQCSPDRATIGGSAGIASRFVCPSCGGVGGHLPQGRLKQGQCLMAIPWSHPLHGASRGQRCEFSRQFFSISRTVGGTISAFRCYNVAAFRWGISRQKFFRWGAGAFRRFRFIWQYSKRWSAIS